MPIPTPRMLSLLGDAFAAMLTAKRVDGTVRTPSDEAQEAAAFLRRANPGLVSWVHELTKP
jgi:hypothetical protein